MLRNGLHGRDRLVETRLATLATSDAPEARKLGARPHNFTSQVVYMWTCLNQG